MREIIGMVLMILGTVTADSANLVVPLALMAAGLCLIKGLVEWE